MKKYDILIESIIEDDVTPPHVFKDYRGGIDWDADGNLTVITPEEDDDDDYFDDEEGEPYDIHYPTEKEREEIARLEGVSPEQISYTNILQDYMVAMENDDYSGLSEEDEEYLAAWNAQYRYLWPLTCNNGESPESEFGECDICGLRGDVVPVMILIRRG